MYLPTSLEKTKDLCVSICFTVGVSGLWQGGKT